MSRRSLVLVLSLVALGGCVREESSDERTGTTRDTLHVTGKVATPAGTYPISLEIDRQTLTEEQGQTTTRAGLDPQAAAELGRAVAGEVARVLPGADTLVAALKAAAPQPSPLEPLIPAGGSLVVGALAAYAHQKRRQAKAATGKTA